MPISFTKLFERMKSEGLTTYKIRQERIVNEGTLQRLRLGESVSTDTIGKLCKALNCQPGDLIEYVPD